MVTSPNLSLLFIHHSSHRGAGKMKTFIIGAISVKLCFTENFVPLWVFLRRAFEDFSSH
jgi:hypothetical protein